MNFKNIASHIRIVLIFMALHIGSFAQPNIDKPKAIRAIACVKKDSIILRWAPTHPLAWEYANKNGYIIERYLMVKDGKMVQKPIKQLLVPSPLKPKPLAEWEIAYKRKEDKYIAIGSQAIYGATFQVDAKAGNMFQVINKSKELESRFGFSVFSADQSTEAANLMGLRYVDTQIKKGEKYLYRIYTPFSLNEKIDTGNVFIDADRLSEYPLPHQINAQFTSKKVKLEWDNRFFHDIYSGWFIERSSDNKVWERRNKEPFVNFYENGKPLENITFLDSFPKNNIIYYYRIIGRSYFGELSNPTKSVQGQGISPLDSTPTISSIQLIDKNKLQVMWQMPEKDNPNIKEFRLYRGAKAKGPFKIINTAKPTDRKLMVTDPSSTNYFIISAFGKDSNDYRSLPMLYQLDDETPPIPPVGIKGTIDSNGVVKLTWKPNKEEDLYGYKVFRANRLHEEFSNMTRKIKADTVYYDTLPLQSLAKKMYYKLVALDNHFNPSAFTAAFELKKPDIVAPSSPVFTKILATDTSIVLAWVNSSSEDVIGHVLFRTVAGADEWKLIARFDTAKSKLNQSCEYIDRDKTIDKKLYYQYRILAVDDAKNESIDGQIIKTKLIDSGIRPPINNLTYEINRETQEVILKWEYPTEGVDKILVYKREKDEPLRLFNSVASGVNQFADKSIRINTNYTYKLKAKHKDGGSSPFSPEIIVSF